MADRRALAIALLTSGLTVAGCVTWGAHAGLLGLGASSRSSAPAAPSSTRP